MGFQNAHVVCCWEGVGGGWEGEGWVSVLETDIRSTVAPKVQSSYADGLLSYAAHFSPTLHISLLCYPKFSRISHLWWQIFLLYFSSPLECIFFGGRSLSQDAQYSPTLAKFLFSPRIYLAEQLNSAQKRNRAEEPAMPPSMGGLSLSSTVQIR